MGLNLPQHLPGRDSCTDVAVKYQTLLEQCLKTTECCRVHIQVTTREIYGWTKQYSSVLERSSAEQFHAQRETTAVMMDTRKSSRNVSIPVHRSVCSSLQVAVCAFFGKHVGVTDSSVQVDIPLHQIHLHIREGQFFMALILLPSALLLARSRAFAAVRRTLPYSQTCRLTVLFVASQSISLLTHKVSTLKRTGHIATHCTLEHLLN